MPASTGPGPGGKRDWFAATAAGDVGRHSVSGVLVSGAGQVAAQAMSLVTLLLLARLLTPGDFGLVAMIAAVTGVAGIFQNLGLSAATLRVRNLTHFQASNLFWLNSAAGALMAAAVVAVAPLLEAFYGDPRVQGAASVMSLGLVFGGLGTQHQALLRRAMCFRDIALISTLAVAVTSVVSLACAWLGAAHWALIAGALASSLASAVAGWAMCDWRPALPRRNVGTRAAVQFGVDMMGFGLLAYLARNLHSVLIGHYWGAHAAGLYARAFATGPRITAALMEPLRLVAPAAMGQLAPDPDRFRGYYYRVCAFAVIGAMPVAFVCLVLPREFVAVAFGAQWSDSAPLLMLLALGIVPQVMSQTTGWVYQSAGDSRAMLLWGLVGWSGLIGATLIGVRFGLSGIALATSLAALVLLVPALWLAFRGTPLRVTATLRSVAPAFLAGIAAGLFSAAVLGWLEAATPPARLAAGVGAYGMSYLALLWALPSQRALVVEVLAQLRARRQR